MHQAKNIAVATLVALALASCGGGGSALPTNNAPANQSHPTVRDDWPMYAHDARHTSASAASVSGPLAVAWRYDPQPISGDSFSSTFNAVASINGAYLHWEQSGSGVFSGGPSFDAISAAGQRRWSFVEHKDYDEGHWLSIFGNNVVFNDDGQGFLDVNAGTQVKTPAKTWASSFDLWGESVPDTSGLYSSNDFLADGADIFVYSLDGTGAARWTQNQQVSTKYSQDSNGGLALSNGVLYYAADYSDPSPFASGIYALDAATGHQKAYASAKPTSEMTADTNNIYLFEQSTNLVARSQSDLHIVWSVSAAATTYAAPVLANGLLIAATTAGIQARSAATGKLAWSSSLSPAFGAQNATAMCAALGSSTVLITAYDGLHILRLSDGGQVWHGPVAGVVGVATDPIIVNDPARGAIVYVTDSRGVIALTPH